MRARVLIGCVVWILAGVTCAAGAAAAGGGEEKTVPLSIKGERMRFMESDSMIVWERNVTVQMQDMTLTADRVDAYQDKSAPSGKEDLKKIVATGHVRLRAGDRYVSGEKGVWERDKRTVRITGAPVLRQKDGQDVESDAILYDMVAIKVSFEGKFNARATVTDGNKKEFKGL